jgi:hypothetical protein
MFVQSREDVRWFFGEVYRKSSRGESLEPLEQLIAQVIQMHPEYHGLLESEQLVYLDFVQQGGASNPFLHMSLHLALAEQVASDRPAGIAQIYRNLVVTGLDSHDVEHDMMDCLEKMLWQAQHSQSPADEPAYLECLRRL